MSIVYRFLEGGAATPDDRHIPDDLPEAMHRAHTAVELDDIYRPFRPKRRTRATIAKEKGLEPLSEIILAQDDTNIEDAALSFIDLEKDVPDAESAIAGACDIIAEIISDNADYRKAIRELTIKHGTLSSSASTDHREGGEMPLFPFLHNFFAKMQFFC